MANHQEELSLGSAKQGMRLVVLGTADDETTMQSLRFGINEGSEIFVVKNLKGGPVVIRRHQTEIAIGREIAENIRVRVLA